MEVCSNFVPFLKYLTYLGLNILLFVCIYITHLSYLYTQFPGIFPLSVFLFGFSLFR